ncbi:hypothetical protein [Spirosoma pomorum]
MITQDNISIAQRVTAPKPPIFKKLLKIGGILTVVGTAVAFGPVAPIVATIAGYVATAGTAMTAVAGLPVDFNALAKKQETQP